VSTTPFYDALVASIPEGLSRQVYSVLLNHVGIQNAITLPDLVAKLFGMPPAGTSPKTWYATRERMVRETIELLRRNHRIPILSESGKSGRWIAANQAELDACLRELRARHHTLGDMILSLATAHLPPDPNKLNGPRAQQSKLWS